MPPKRKYVRKMVDELTAFTGNPSKKKTPNKLRPNAVVRINDVIFQLRALNNRLDVKGKNALHNIISTLEKADIIIPGKKEADEDVSDGDTELRGLVDKLPKARKMEFHKELEKMRAKRLASKHSNVPELDGLMTPAYDNSRTPDYDRGRARAGGEQTYDADQDMAYDIEGTVTTDLDDDLVLADDGCDSPRYEEPSTLVRFDPSESPRYDPSVSSTCDTSTSPRYEDPSTSPQYLSTSPASEPLEQLKYDPADSPTYEPPPATYYPLEYIPGGISYDDYAAPPKKVPNMYYGNNCLIDSRAHGIPYSFLDDGKWIVNDLYVTINNHDKNRFHEREAIIKEVQHSRCIVFIPGIDCNTDMDFDQVLPMQPKTSDYIRVIYGDEMKAMGKLLSSEEGEAVVQFDNGEMRLIPLLFCCKMIPRKE